VTQKTFVVTGATDGIGKETAYELLTHGHRVLVHGRTQAKANAAATELTVRAKSGTAVPIVGDLSNLAEVRSLAAVIAKEPRLDVIIHNAGVFASERKLTGDGHELTVAVNHYAPFLLTKLLLDRLRASASPTSRARVVNVASVAHNRGNFDPDDMTFKKGWSGYGAYAASKLMNVLFTYELARRLGPDSGVATFALHPGVIGTKLLKEGFGIGGASLSEGTKTSLFAATSPTLEGKTGLYLDDAKIATSSAKSRDEKLAARLWELSEAAVG
jgi:NAD(P)-dependent dehydrogenase (short-subunit alcohol dehydrogenase family)